ncbi:MAG: hypothetical protein GY862_36045 [Gammaproteobacteria bacterium]|nr:hypothetical protein [Gammaproteobacteria bacterium]
MDNITSEQMQLMVISSIISAIIGVAFSVLLSKIKLIKNYFNTGVDYLIKDWYIYNVSFKDNKEVINKGRWMIRKSLLGGIKINIRYFEENEVLGDKVYYKGRVYEEAGSIVVVLKANTHLESVFCRLDIPNPANTDVISGIWLGTDLDFVNTSGLLVLSDKTMNDNAVKKHFDERFESLRYAQRIHKAG